MSMTVGELVAYLDIEDKAYHSKLDKAETRFSSFGSKVGGMSSMVGKVALGAAVGGVAALGAGLVAGAVAGVRYNSSIQQTTIAMGTMLGSTAKAKTLIGEVTKMAAATPFEFPELADATKRLVAYGVSAKDAVPLMTRLGDISSALNIPIGEMADLYGKMKVSGRISMEDINQMAGRGIPIYKALADTLGVSQGKIRGLVETGKVGFPDVEKAVKGLTDKGSMFGGMMDKQSRSFSGLWSTVKDGLIATFAVAVKPLFTWLTKTGMPTLVKWMPAITKTVQGAMKVIGGLFKGIGAVFSFVKGLFSGGGGLDTSGFIGPLKSIWTALNNLWDVVKGPVKTAAAYLWKVLGQAFNYLKPTMIEFEKTIAVVIGYVVRLAQFIKRHWAGILTVVGPIFAILKAIVVTAFKVIAGVVRVVMAVIRGDWKGAWNGIKRILSDVGKGLVTILKAFGRLLVAALKAVWALILMGAKAAWGLVVGAVKSKWRELTGSVKGVFNGIKTAIASAWQWVADKTSDIWNGILRTIAGFVNQIIRIVNYLPGVDIGLVTWGSSKAAAAGTQGRGGVNAYAQGIARVNRPTMALIGEDGPEAVLPLSKPHRMKAILRELGLMSSSPITGMTALGQRPPLFGGIPAFGEGGIVGNIKGFFGDLWGDVKGAIGALGGLINGLSIPKLPSMLAGFLPNILSTVWASVKSKFQSEFGVRPQIVRNATEHIGDPYVWGGTSPGGFDCSGLIYHAYNQAGKSIPRIPVYGGKVISPSQMQPADVLLYNPGAVQEGVRVPFGHYRMYAGSGKTIESGGGGVHMDSLANVPPAQVRSFLGSGWMGRGGSFIANTPTIFGAGEKGPERIDVTPLGQGRSGVQVVQNDIYLDGELIASQALNLAEQSEARSRRGHA